MADRDEIVSFCDDLLDSAAFEDYGPNGLQLPGTELVAKIATGVSAHLELLQRARDAGAQLLLAHHGLFWDADPRRLDEPTAARLRLALAAEISVVGYHLPLDAHAQIGNNVLLCRELGFEPQPQAFAEVRGRAIGAVGRRSEPVAAQGLFGAVAEALGRSPLVFDAGPAEVTSIGVLTGAGAGELRAAIAIGLDAFITGEPAERAMAEAREGAIHFIAAGHYATETFGIRRLGELVAERFAVEHQFIEVPNPI